MVDLRAAYASCERDARAHYENFPVASLLLPSSMRPHVAAVYAFARAADDLADEGRRPSGERLRLLDAWAYRLHEAAARPDAEPRPAEPGEPANTPQIFSALAATIRARHLPVPLFDDLLSAFRQDVTVMRYGDWSELYDYCRRSANPVGRLVLRIAGAPSAQMDAWSDDICTALQLTNFWQDLAADYARGRLYVPLEELRRHGAGERALAADRVTPEWTAVLVAVTARTRELFARGRPLCDEVRGRLRYELRATWLGGTRLLDRLAASGRRSFSARPVLGTADLPWLASSLLAWPLGARGNTAP